MTESSINQYRVVLKAHDREVAIRLLHDPMFLASASLRQFAENWCEPEVSSAMMRVLRPGDSAIDIGANLGFFSLLMAKLVGDNGHVTAVEPFIENYKRMGEHVTLNGLVNVRTANVAAWDYVRDLPLYISPDSGECSLRLTPGAAGSHTVSAWPVDKICPGETPKVVKIDAEGAELHVLRGMPEILAQSPFCMVELNADALARFGHRPIDVRNFMKDCGYDCFMLRQDGSLPILLPPRTTVHTVWLNFMVLFSTIEKVGSYWQEIDLGDRRP